MDKGPGYNGLCGTLWLSWHNQSEPTPAPGMHLLIKQTKAPLQHQANARAAGVQALRKQSAH